MCLRPSKARSRQPGKSVTYPLGSTSNELLSSHPVISGQRSFSSSDDNPVFQVLEARHGFEAIAHFAIFGEIRAGESGLMQSSFRLSRMFFSSSARNNNERNQMACSVRRIKSSWVNLSRETK
jgi:hypothetical protein